MGSSREALSPHIFAPDFFAVTERQRAGGRGSRSGLVFSDLARSGFPSCDLHREMHRFTTELYCKLRTFYFAIIGGFLQVMVILHTGAILLPPPTPSLYPPLSTLPCPDHQPQVLVLALNTGGFHCILAGSIVLFGLVFCFSFAASCFLIRWVGSTILCSPR